ncbi:ligand-binding sensor domain-containing protein/AraC-like DNA-binding protein/signal transduction histidine kinase [Wenyingzhuangia heitensis]|uniref:Ligand-binding sensor domain-containing protein/AraC-like DNA-binding protein/signal transduction histidine kinase n=1 Tax=Wenyingzhuangia heitensis TaxID=1487859 RepID=A0ABX0U735_9FLAO|nr:AraC family transcriptional regulator [Wenyingzhuangia heitensis]NIJ43998.1 ligand-binding sensor domain-containing protein/AraC-like DNA-binding protein/signal transduction histidine kinase [Wenyingzhuangia heitensis]
MKFWIFFLYSFVSFFALGQEIKFKTYTTNQGLSNNSILDIENDENGGLWIATLDGLNYFDGNEFVVYKHIVNDSTSIAGNYIYDIKKDSQGAIWVKTSQGKTSKYIGNGLFKNFSFKNEPINSIGLSTSNNIIAYTNKRTYEYLDNVFVAKKTIAQKSDNYNSFSKILLEKYPTIIINDVLKDKKGNIWFATRRNGVYIIPNHHNNIQNNHIDHYIVDKYSPYTFNSNEVDRLHLDMFNNVWLGHKDGGLSMAYKDSELIYYVTPHPIKYPHLPNETIRAITKKNKGQLWLGYYNKGLYYYSNKTECYIKYIIPEAKDNVNWERIRSLFTASDDSVWAGSYAGLIRVFSNGEYELHNAETIKELPNNRSYSICEDDSKNLWIGCWGGVAKFNLVRNKFEVFKGQDTLSSYHIRNIKIEGDELILATEFNGVLVLNTNNGSLTKINTSKGVLDNSIYSVLKDKNTNNYWIASLGGITIYNAEKGIVKNITEQNGLFSHMVYGLIDAEDKVWLSTTKGLAFVDKATYQVTTINPNEGWQAPEFSEGAYYQDPKGMLFFAGVNGLNYFNPSTIRGKEYKSKIKLKIDDNENYAKQLVKKHSNNDVKVNVSTITFPSSRKEQIYFKLEGFDVDWRLLETQVIDYHDLPSGNYEFYVKSVRDNIPSNSYFTLKIEKALYETIGFYIIISLLFMVTVVVVFWIRNKSNKKLKERLEQKIIDRTQVIENQKQDLLKANKELDEKNKEVSHQKEKLLELHNSLKNEDFELEKFKSFVLSEFQEPVSKIIRTSAKIEGDTKAKEQIINQATSMINLLSEWDYLDHVKDLGAVKNSIVNLFPILKNILENNKKSAQKNQVNFISHIDKDITWVEVDVLRIRLLIQYFLGDLVKYSDKKSKLDIAFVYQNNALELKVISNSELLISNWDHVVRYSPYFKAVKTLLTDLSGVFSLQKEQDFVLSFKIPLFKMNPDFKQTETISWKHMNDQELLNNGKRNILVLSNDENVDIVKQLLEDKQSNLIFENSVSDLMSAMQQINIDVLVLYQTPFTKQLVGFFNKFKSKETKKESPFVYISEEISYTLQEQSVEYGIDAVIQLPASESYIKKKIAALTQPKENVETHQLQKNIFQILTEDQELETGNDKLIKKSLEIIKRELSNSNFNVEMLIDQLSISRVKCYRLFKDILGQSPSDVITSLRFQKAEYLLKNKNLNISEISYECGFNDPKYFGKSFKKYFGLSPKAFKSQNETL